MRKNRTHDEVRAAVVDILADDGATPTSVLEDQIDGVQSQRLCMILGKMRNNEKLITQDAGHNWLLTKRGEEAAKESLGARAPINPPEPKAEAEDELEKEGEPPAVTNGNGAGEASLGAETTVGHKPTLPTPTDAESVTKLPVTGDGLEQQLSELQRRLDTPWPKPVRRFHEKMVTLNRLSLMIEGDVGRVLESLKDDLRTLSNIAGDKLDEHEDDEESERPVAWPRR